LFRKSADKAIATKYKISLETLENINKSKLQMPVLNIIKPRLDDKILTAWNGLMLKATLLLIAPLTNLLFLNKAIKNANFLTNETITIQMK
jgi:uncharacterized protein YyaL (SSP411 family)